MKSTAFDTIYLNVPQAEKEQLIRFRATHPVKNVTAAGARWENISCGRGEQALLLLPGALGIGEMAFQHILAFENEYRVISPTYPSTLTTMAQLVEGIVGILDAENVRQAHVLGSSYGGMVAQCLVRQYPDRLGKLILSHTGGPKPKRAGKNKKFIAALPFLPMGVWRALLRLVTRKVLSEAPAQQAFWQAYSNEMIATMTKADLVSRYQVAIDFDENCTFARDDLVGWPGSILILEGEDDPLAEARERDALKALYPQAQVHTFHGTGHIASVAKLEEYVSVVQAFLS